MNTVIKKYFVVEDEIADFERHTGKKVSERFKELLLNLEPIVNMAYEAGRRDGLRGTSYGQVD